MGVWPGNGSLGRGNPIISLQYLKSRTLRLGPLSTLLC